MEWKKLWKVFLLVAFNLYSIQCDVMHYYKMKKFLTAVAFARALGRRQTILPIPIPIPIPLGGSNEILKIPSHSGNGKVVFAIPGGGEYKGSASSISSLLSGLGKGYSGSSSFGYSLPGISSSNSKVINLSSLSGSGSNNIATLLSGGGSSSGNSIASLFSGGGSSIGSNIASLFSGGGSNMGRNRVMIVDAGDLGNILNMGASSNTGLGTVLNAGSLPISMGSGLSNMQFSNMHGLTSSNMGDLQQAYSLKSFHNVQKPQNIYSDKSFRKIPMRFRGRRMHDSLNKSITQTSSALSQNEYSLQPSNEQSRPLNNNGQQLSDVKKDQEKKPIPVGEKFRSRYFIFDE